MSSPGQNLAKIPHFGSFRLVFPDGNWAFDVFSRTKSSQNPSFRQPSAAGNPETSRGPGNGFRKRTDYCEIDDFAAFVGFPSFRQLSAGADLVYLSFWMGTNLETVTKFRAFGGSSRTNSGFVLLSPGRNLGTPAFGGHRRPEIQEIHQGLGNGFRKRSGLYKIDKFWAFVGFPPFRLSQKPEIQEIHRGLGNGFRKRSGLYKIHKFWAFVGFPHFGCPRSRKSGNPQGPWKWLPEQERTLQNRQLLRFCRVPSISAVPEAGNPEIHRCLGNGFRKRSGLYKINKFLVFVGFPFFRRSQKPEIQEIHRGLGNGFRKRSGLCKINKF